MHAITLPTNRPRNDRVLLVLLALIVPAAFLGLPFAATLLEAGQVPREAPLWYLVSSALVNVAIVFVLAGIGFRLACSFGLGLPFIEAAVSRAPVWHRFPGVLAVGIISGVGMILVIGVLHLTVFGPLLEAQMESLGIQAPDIEMPAWQRFLASSSAGVLEEIVYRLFALTLLAWLGSLIFHDAEGRPPLTVLWIANLVIAVGFALAHLPFVEALGLPMTPLVITRTLVYQGFGSLVLGWLYWSRGLESAMVAHAVGNYTVVTGSLILGVATPWLAVLLGVAVSAAFVALVLALLRWQPAEPGIRVHR